jgi:hypothetical protein
VTEARAEPVPADPATARIGLDEAERFLSDGDEPALSEESRHLLYWQACLSLLDAVLLAGGRRVTSGAGGHMLRLSETHAVLGANHPDLFERLDLHRGRRHDVSYRGAVSSAEDTAALRGAAEELLELAREYVAG